MADQTTQGDVTSTVTVKIRGGRCGSRNVSRRSITTSAMNNAKTSFEIEGHSYSNSDWSKIMRIADRLEAVI